MRVFGYMRFSYAGRSDVRTSRLSSTLEDVAARLYDPIRMERRFLLFENICLPSIAAQTNTDFRIAVLASNIMPDVYKQRLAAAVEKIPQFEIVYSDADHVNHAFNPWQEAQTAGLNFATAHFRLDDDDAISRGTIDRIANACNLAPHVGILSFPRGLHVSYMEQRAHIIREYTPFIAIALSYLNMPGQIRNPYMGNHVELHKLDRSLIDPMPWTYLHTAHDSSDTLVRQPRRIQKFAASDPDYDTPKGRNVIAKILRKEFSGLTVEVLEDIMRIAKGLGGSAQADQAEAQADLSAYRAVQ